MQIFVNPVSGPDGLKEWCMIELQGDLESRSLDGLRGFVGDLHFTNDNTPVLIIGHHILYGKVQSLEKAFAVLDKKSTLNKQTEYVVTAVIKKKLIFRDRPKPIVTLGSKKV
ncbi:unnamed protein product [Allacma fusca]|uniref:Chromosome transmission fidelity protein 8 n=1 Tax=Allacma fusca TaxID=39272 RepID=A0A8J2PN79_9HEXA|nr:unnamed protein product [Allacma fusca]